MITVSNPPSTVSVPVATTSAEGKTKVDNNMSGDPIAITTHSIDQALGVAGLDVDGKISDGELPDIVAFTDVANTFTNSPQTIDDGTGSTNTLYPNEIDIVTTQGEFFSSPGTGTLFSSTEDACSLQFINTNDNNDLFIAIQDGGGDVSFNAINIGGPILLNKNGPATNIHQDEDGTIHLQTFPTGTQFDPITWTDALIINNDASVSMVNTLTIVDDFGNENDIDPSIIQISDGLGNYAIIVPGTMYTQNDDGGPSILASFSNISMGSIVTTPDGVDFSFNNYEFGPVATYYGDAPATNVHQDADGSIHLQVAPTGMTGDPITWTDALIINNDATTTVNTITSDDGVTSETVVYPAEIMMTDGTGTGEYYPDQLSVSTGNFSSGVTSDSIGSSDYIDVPNTGYLLRVINGIGVSLDINSAYSDMAGHWIHNNEGPNYVSNILFDTTDGSIKMRTGPLGDITDTITWTDAIIINNDGTINLASTPTTATAPAAGMADALPLLPTGYATIDVGGTPRKFAFY